jgi:hypothetical protein
MNLDLRIPMGLMFSFVGVILAAYGAATNSDPANYAKSLGINVNLWWGLVLLVFGQIMYHTGRRAHIRQQKNQSRLPPPANGDTAPRRGH